MLQKSRSKVELPTDWVNQMSIVKRSLVLSESVLTLDPKPSPEKRAFYAP